MKKVRDERVKGIYGRKKKIIIGVTCLLGIICAIIIAFTFYGQNVGSFSIKLGDDLKNRSIFISTDSEFSWYKSRLEAEPLEDATPCSVKFILQNECKRANGSYIGSNKGYVGYTFYLKNLGTETVNVAQICRLSGFNEENGIDNVSWFWYFEDDANGIIYQKEDKNAPDGYWDDEDLKDYPSTTPFLDEGVVFSKSIMDLKPGDVKKFTLITWIEANDPDMSEAMKDQKIRYELSFSVYEED